MRILRLKFILSIYKLLAPAVTIFRGTKTEMTNPLKNRFHVFKEGGIYEKELYRMYEVHTIRFQTFFA